MKLPWWIRFVLWLFDSTEKSLLDSGAVMVRGEIPRPLVRAHETAAPLPVLPPPPPNIAREALLSELSQLDWWLCLAFAPHNRIRRVRSGYLQEIDLRWLQ